MYSLLQINRNKFAVLQKSAVSRVYSATERVEEFGILWTFAQESAAVNVIRALNNPRRTIGQDQLLGRVRAWAEKNPGEKYPFGDCP